MSRKDVHLDAMLRHLGAAYYDSLHGRATQPDVTRAVNQVAREMGEQAVVRQVPPLPPRPRAGEPHHRPATHHGRWHSRVRDIMTTDIVAIDRITPFKQIAWLMVQHQINGVPVLGLGRHVAGVVTEGDLIAARHKNAGQRRRWTGTPRHGSARSRYDRLTGEQLMTAPAITIHPDTSMAGAGRLMTDHHIKLLPVVDQDGKIVGVVSRRDLLSVFLVPDSEVARQVRELIYEIAPGEPSAIKVEVQCGIVTLTGQPEAELRNQVAAAIDAAWDLDGVLDIIDHAASPQPA
ncbi:MAG TPA: CBS domain-containing protein [Streptosporangiaceae bacterium]|jgi:CBS-domain-containing membrane protein|nr:CBS domain-containing protein [Streptosporangiaceae bacterium]